ncbi:MAG: PDZ domain-containing protein [Ruminococcaceae bacterium]|nr:PDZ domain-containing protein [Oscillospiraceae bacterium]
MALACLVCGFGGGYAATLVAGTNSGSGAEPAVIYKAPEDGGGSASGVNQTDSLTVADIAAKAGASVVSITTENEVRDFYSGGRVVSGAGSGVILTEDGYIITNNHVVTGAQTVKVTLSTGEEYDATVVGADARTDVAVVKINVTGLTPAVVGDSDSLKVGEFCLAIGNSMGTLGGTVTNGIISALNREITIEGQTMNLLQMNAAVSPGNSGGGLFNDKGQLVGIVNAKSSGEDAEGLGFAIPVNTAIQVAESLIAHGYVAGRPGLGVTVETITTEEYAQQAGVSAPGVYIDSITKGSAADTAGLQVGDRVLTADGVNINTGNDLGTLIAEKAVGDSLVLEIERDGRTLQVNVVLGELKA